MHLIQKIQIQFHIIMILITDKGISYKDNMNTCMFKGCLRCKAYRNENNIKMRRKGYNKI